LRGFHDARVKLVGAGPILAATSEASEPPRPAEPALRMHDSVVRALADVFPAVMPMRFGSVVDSASALAARLQPVAAELTEALKLVAGRRQMTLRVFGKKRSRPPAGPKVRGGPGTRYLHQLTARRRWERSVPELDSVRSLFDGVVRAERAQRETKGDLIASVYHLVDVDSVAEYLAAIDRAQRAAAPSLRLLSSGPHPAYAFAPEGLS
jgi:hypothetical protein